MRKNNNPGLRVSPVDYGREGFLYFNCKMKGVIKFTILGNFSTGLCKVVKTTVLNLKNLNDVSLEVVHKRLIRKLDVWDFNLIDNLDSCFSLVGATNTEKEIVKESFYNL